MIYVVRRRQPCPFRDGERRFPVQRVYCVGRNYAEHAIEMGHDPDARAAVLLPEEPGQRRAWTAAISLTRRGPRTCTTRSSSWSRSKRGGKNIPVERALDHVYGYAVGLDMTRRDLQGEAKKLGRPWEIGKAFEHSAPCRRYRAGQRDRPLSRRRDLAEGERRAAAAGRPQPDDLEDAGDDLLSLGLFRARRRAISSCPARRPASAPSNGAT